MARSMFQLRSGVVNRCEGKGDCGGGGGGVIVLPQHIIPTGENV